MWPPILLAVTIAAILILRGQLVRQRARCDRAWDGVERHLDRRIDLIPQVVDVITASVSGDLAPLDAVVEARAHARAARGPIARAVAEGELTHRLQLLLAHLDAPPERRSPEPVIELRRRLAEAEDGILDAADRYNASVAALNARLARIPYNLVAIAFRIQPSELFAVDAADREIPRVRT